MKKKVLGLILAGSGGQKFPEAQIGWAIREYDTANDVSYIVPEYIRFSGKTEYEIKDDFIYSRKDNVKYSLFHTKDIEEAEKMFMKLSDKFGNIYGAVSKDGKHLIVANRLCTDLTEDETQSEAIKVMDWYQGKK
ncbi:hypothetical protein [Flavobacterium psychrotrophum]|uniref:hypothetical protein n=1 Tax=Flavobacterium psychrotrophum TaxID=2294119 RepID=UPI000E321541|nr:hypothetical protein [Flavobacterium psychrotrophum]